MQVLAIAIHMIASFGSGDPNYFRNAIIFGFGGGTYVLAYKMPQKTIPDDLIESVGPSKLLENEHFKMCNFAF